MDINRLRGYFNSDSPYEMRIAILKTIYEIDSEIPFLPKYPSNNIAEIVHSFGYEDCSEDEWTSLSDGRLLSWMYSHEDKMACESLRIMTQGQEPTRSLGYKVLYNIDRDAAYDLREADTPLKVGEILCEQMRQWQHLTDEEFAEAISDYSSVDGRFVYFAQLHGWFEPLSQCRACFDLRSEENRERLSAYDLRTAAYRFCRILGALPTYVLQDGLELRDGRNFDKLAHRPALIPEIKRGALCQWMSVFFHEDPNEEFNETYSYERTLEKWLLDVGEIDHNQRYYKRYVTAKEETARKYKEVRTNYHRARAKENMWRLTYYVLCALWIGMVALLGINNRDYVFSHTLLTISLPLGGMTAVIVGTRAYFRGYDVMFSCLWGLLGALSSFIPIIILKYMGQSHPSLFNISIIVITLIYMLVCHLTDFRGDQKADSKLVSEVLQNDIKSTLLEPLYYTFKTKSYRFKGSKFGLLNDVTDQVRSISGESVLHYVLWSMLALIFVLDFIIFSPSLLNVSNPDINNMKTSPSEIIKQLERDVE